MKWALEVKLIQNYDSFSEILLSTNDKAIVEYSARDNIWGAAFNKDNNTFIGINALGRLLMQLREDIKMGKINNNSIILSPNISAFLLFGNRIKEVRNNEYFIHDLDEIYS